MKMKLDDVDDDDYDVNDDIAVVVVVIVVNDDTVHHVVVTFVVALNVEYVVVMHAMKTQEIVNYIKQVVMMKRYSISKKQEIVEALIDVKDYCIDLDYNQ